MPYAASTARTHDRSPQRSQRRRRWRLGMLAALAFPLLMALGAPVAAALVPGVLLTAAALPMADMAHRGGHELDGAVWPVLVDEYDPVEQRRIASAQDLGRFSA